MDWKILTLIVCTFGFFKDLRPSEAYLTQYLTGEWKNLTETQVDNEVYPWWTYSYLLWLVPVFLLTDYFRYKPMLIVDGLAYITTWVLLLWTQGVPAMKLMQVTYGLATAAEIGYNSYLYAVVPKENFKKVASFTRAASLTGKFVAYLLSQLFVSYELLNYFQLNIFSFVSVCVAFLITFAIPRAQHSELFNPDTQTVNNPNYDTNETGEKENNGKGVSNESYKNTETGENSETSEKVVSENKSTTEEKSDSPQETSNTEEEPVQVRLNSPKSVVLFLYNEIKVIYSSKTVLIWSIWWAFASCGNFQVGNYIQNLWKHIAPHKANRHIYNGSVEAAGTLFSSISVILIAFVPFDWSIRGRGEALMASVCALNAGLLIILGRTTEIWVAYILYDVFRATYQIVITIASAQIAKSLVRQRYGFVFGCNTFVALVIESILTAIVVDENGLGVDVRTQFIVYGGYFFFIALLFFVVAVLQFCNVGCLRTYTVNIQYRDMTGHNEENSDRVL